MSDNMDRAFRIMDDQDREIQRLRAENDRLREWQRQMVEKAASGGRLDGYRELAGKLAAKDAEIDRLRAALVAAMEVVKAERERITQYDFVEPKRAEELDAIIAQADAALGREG